MRFSRNWLGCTPLMGALIFAVAICTAAHAAPETRFTIVDSSSSSWVARGYKNYTVSPSIGWTFSASRNFSNGVGFTISGTALPGTSVTDWGLNFSAPNNALITPGVYPNFARWPFQASDQPGLEFESTGRLDNQAAGTFTVYDATYSSTGQVLSFAADFTHYGETIPANYAIAQIRYNTNVPEPTTAALLVPAYVVMLARRSRTHAGK
jgi:hypothetical protein